MRNGFTVGYSGEDWRVVVDVIDGDVDVDAGDARREQAAVGGAYRKHVARLALAVKRPVTTKLAVKRPVTTKPSTQSKKLLQNTAFS